MNLRPYQETAVAGTIDGWQKYDRLLGVAPTGAGKTIIFADITRQRALAGRTLIVAHREELIDQAIHKLHAAVGIFADKEKAEFRASLQSRVVVASIQTLAARKDRFAPDHFATIIVDECFVAGTLIDNEPIETLQKGDRISSYNHELGWIEHKRVTHLFKSRPRGLVRLTLSDGREIICTPDHPFCTPLFQQEVSWRYVSASSLTGVVVYGITNQQTRQLQRVRSDRDLQQSEPCAFKSRRAKEIASFLHEGASANKQGPLILRDNGEDKPQIRLGANDAQQSHEAPGIKGEDENNTPRNGMEAAFANGEWNRPHSTAVAACFKAGMGDGSSSPNKKRKVFRLSDKLQTGHRKLIPESGNRSGWNVSLQPTTARAGREENGIASSLRVERVEVLQQTSDGTFGGLCPDGFVYNIEVQGNNNYFANGVLVHNCHHVLADSYQRSLAHFTGAKVLGVTATADRSDKKNLGEYFEEVAFELNLLDLIKQGFLAKIVCKTVPLKIDLTGVKKLAGDFSAADLGDALEPVLRAAVEEIRVHAADRKRIIVFLPLCATSRQFTAMCNAAGITAKHIDGNSQDRREIQSAFSRGEFRLLANSMLLTEGYDEPGIDCVIVLRPTQSRGLYAQMIGRGTRLAPGKENLLILDFLWHVEKHSLIKPAHLIASSREEADAMTDYMEQEQDLAGSGILFDGQASLDLEMNLEDAMTEVRAQREATLRKKIEAQAKKASRLIDPVEFGLDLHELSIAEFEPTMHWHENKISDKQRACLTNAGLDPDTVSCAGHAAAILDAVFARRRMGLASPKQVAWLKKMKHPAPVTATFEEASAFLDKAFKKGGAR